MKSSPLQPHGDAESLPLQGPTLAEIAAARNQPVTCAEFYREGAALRDLIAQLHQEMERLGTRVGALERTKV